MYDLIFWILVLFLFIWIVNIRNFTKWQNRREYNIYVNYSSKVTFIAKEEHMQLFVPLFLSSSFKLCHVFCLILWENGHIKAQHWSRNESFTEVYKRHFLLQKWALKKLFKWKTSTSSLKWNSTIFSRRYTLHLNIFTFCYTKIYVIELKCLFTLWVLLNHCFHSNFCLWKSKEVT